MTASRLVRLDGGRRSLVSLLVLAGAASAAGWPCARHRRSGAEAARHARNGWCKVPFQTARCRIVGCTTAPKLRGCPEPPRAMAALAGRERTGTARESVWHRRGPGSGRTAWGAGALLLGAEN
jgi:hypothetical protein